MPPHRLRTRSATRSTSAVENWISTTRNLPFRSRPGQFQSGAEYAAVELLGLMAVAVYVAGRPAIVFPSANYSTLERATDGVILSVPDQMAFCRASHSTMTRLVSSGISSWIQ